MKKRIQKYIETAMQRPWIRYPSEVVRRFDRDNGTMNAAGLAFFLLLSLSPMILAGVAILSLIIPTDHAVAAVHGIVNRLLPAGAANTELHRLLGHKVGRSMADLARGSGWPAVIGVLTLVWVSMQIFVTGSTAMNTAFGVAEKRNWFVVRLIALGLLIATGSLLFVSLALSYSPTIIYKESLPIEARLPISLRALNWIFEVVAVMINAGLFVLIYRYLPSTRVSWRSAFAGGVVASVLFEIAKKGLALFFLRPNTSIYGGLADLIVFILWIYYSMIIFLLGSEVVAVHALYNESSSPVNISKPPRPPRRMRGWSAQSQLQGKIEQTPKPPR